MGLIKQASPAHTSVEEAIFLNTWKLILICTLTMGLLAGCASSADNTAPPTMQPARTTRPPAATNVPSAAPTGEPAASAMSITTVDDAKRVAGQIEEALEKLSEVDEAHVVVFGNAALVGVEYDDEYQGGTTQRVEDMVKDRIKTIHQGIDSVYVTDESLQVKAIKALEDVIDTGNVAFEELSREAQKIVDGMKDAKSPAATAGPTAGSAA